MELIVQQSDLVEVMAYDNMINAFISRLMNAIHEQNTALTVHYTNEIRLATHTKSTLLHRMRNEERSPLHLVQ